MTTAQPESGTRRSVFGRAETSLSHAVYGLILSLATVGQLLAHESEPVESIAWLLGAGAVLLVARLFSELLARIASSREELHRADLVEIGAEDVAVVAGFLGAVAVVAAAAGIGIDHQSALIAIAALGLAALAGLTFYATVQRPMAIRAVVALGATVLGGALVTLEQVV